MMRIATFLSITIFSMAVLPAQGVAHDCDEIAGWIDQLDDEAFKLREAAVMHLSDAGLPAVAPLAEVMRSGSPEARLRALVVLKRLAVSEDTPTESAVFNVLQALADSGSPAESRRFQKTLISLRKRQAERTIAAIKRYGGSITRTGGSNKTQWTVRFDADDDVKRALVEMPRLPGLFQLALPDTSIDDASLAHVSNLPTLERLFLENTAITTAGLKRMKNLPKLTFLETVAAKSGFGDDTTRDLV